MKRRFHVLVMVSMGLFALTVLCNGKAIGQEQITLKYNAWTQPRGGFARTCNTYLDKIEKRSNGRVKFEKYWTGTLIPSKEEVAGVGKGLADIAIVKGGFQKRLSLLQAAALPGIGANLETQGRVIAELAKMKPIRDQFDEFNLKFVAANGGDPYDLISSKPVRSASDLERKKIRCVGDAAVTLKKLGAVPVALTSSECYEALERGIVDGILMAPIGVYVWRLHEAKGVEYYTKIGLSCNVFYFMMNKDSWNRLPDDIKGIFEKAGQEQIDDYVKIYHEEYVPVFKAFEKKGIELIDFSAADKKKVTEAAQVAWDRWLKDQEKRGLPGQEVLDTCLELNGLK